MKLDEIKKKVYQDLTYAQLKKEAIKYGIDKRIKGIYDLRDLVFIEHVCDLSLYLEKDITTQLLRFREKCLQVKESRAAAKAAFKAEQKAASIKSIELKREAKLKIKDIKELEKTPAECKRDDRIKIMHENREILALVIATDLFDKRSGYTFYRFREIFPMPNGTELLGGYFFKRNYNIPKKDKQPRNTKQTSND